MWEWALVAQGIALLGLLGRLWWPLDLANHLAPICAALALVGLLAAAVLRARRAAVALALASALGLARLAPERAAAAPADGRPLRIAVANVHTSNTDPEPLLRWLREVDPDVIGLLEVDDRWLADLAPLAAGWPESLAVPRSDNFGVALLARVPLADARAERLATAPVPTIRADLPGGVHLVLTHPLPPIGREYAALRDDQLAAIARLRGPRTVVIGDLNATPWSTAFPGRSPGWRPGTWPAFLPGWLRIPIDHVLVGDGVRLERLRVGPDVGSDHRPLVADLVVPAGP